MDVSILSRQAMEELLRQEIPSDTAIISFHDPVGRGGAKDYRPIDFSGFHGRLMQIPVHDIDPEVLPEFGLTLDSYFPEAGELAEFILEASDQRIICQCEYGQSRSAGCAAAILEFFAHRGIDIFTDYRYYPNQLIYHKVYDALQQRLEQCMQNTNSSSEEDIQKSLADQQLHKKSVLAEADRLITGPVRLDAEDTMLTLRNGCEVYERLNSLMDARNAMHPRAKVPFRIVLNSALMALQLMTSCIQEQSIPQQELPMTCSGQFIKSLAGELDRQFTELCKENNLCREDV